MAAGPGNPRPQRHDPLITPAAVTAALRALWAEVARPVWRLLSGGLTAPQVARNGPTVGLLLAAYGCAVLTALR